jgi:Histone methylation protein DOT1
MVDQIIQDIQIDLNTAESDQSIFIEKNFVQRASALDKLEFRVIHRIENVLYEHGYREDLARLQHQAAELWKRLDAINETLFDRLRQTIAHSHDRGAIVRRAFETYTHGYSENSRDPLGYDALDTFVNGLIGIDTEPQETRPILPGMIGYQATPARVILTFIAQVNLTGNDVFYDLGSGLGRVVMLVGLLSDAQARGIEFEPAYCTYAQQRASRLGLSQVRFINADARAADLSEGTVFFMYTPFTGNILTAVLERLQQEAQARSFVLVTYGPCTQYILQEDWVKPISDMALRDRDIAIFKTR